MDWILGRLACGSLEDAIMLGTMPSLMTMSSSLCGSSALQQSHMPSSIQIDCVLTLCEQPCPPLPSVTHGHRHPIPDETWLPPDLWQNRVETLRIFLHAGATVLVHCRLGVSRAPALCAAYLIQCGMDADEARQYVEARRAVTNIHPETWRGIVEWNMQR